MTHSPRSQEVPSDKDQKQRPETQNLSRRKALKTIAALTGAAALSTLPTQWSHPSTQIGTLPVFAQASPTPTPVNGCTLTAGTLEIVMTWDTDANLELHVFEACSFIDVAPAGFGGPEGITIRHLGDAQGGAGSSETITQITAGQVAEGTYGIHIGHVSGTLPATATVTITTDQGTSQFTRTFTQSGYLLVADVTYPGGTVTETTGPLVVSRSDH